MSPRRHGTRPGPPVIDAFAARLENAMRKLRRVVGQKWVGGVCAGVAYWLGAPTWLVRLGWVVLGFCYGIGVVPYVLLWVFMPRWDETPEDYQQRSGG